jgi:hypothetical protein
MRRQLFTALVLFAFLTCLTSPSFSVVGIPAVTFTPNPVTFGTPQPLGTTSAPIVLTITNSGNATLTISNATPTNTVDFDTHSSGSPNPCPDLPANLTPTQSCTLNVTFHPMAAGTRTGSLIFSDNTSGGSDTITFSGNGLAKPASVLSDFDGDHKADLDWHNDATGEEVVWRMDGLNIGGYMLGMTIPDSNWRPLLAADFNGDGKADLLWHNSSTGANYLWMTNSSLWFDGYGVEPVNDPNWQIIAAADFDGDGKADLLWRNSQTGDNYVWLMNGSTMKAPAWMQGVTGTDWQFVTIADFNGDGHPDILWHNVTTGVYYAWLMNGTTIVSGAVPGTINDPNWQLAAVADFNGDGRAELLWRNVTTGDNYMWLLDSNGNFASGAYVDGVSDLNWQIAAVGDLDGDGKADIVWRNTSTGANYAWLMDGPTLVNSAGLPALADQNWKLAGFQSYTNIVSGAISVSLSPSSPQSVATNGTLQITPTVLNDSSNLGVNLQLNPTNCGTLSTGNDSTVASGYTVTYSAPPTTCSATVTATSLADPNQTAQLTINVNQPLSIQTPIYLPTAYTGQSYSNAGINAQGGTGSYTWTANPISGSLPPGLSLTNLNGSTLMFAGSPSATGSYTFTVQVTDGVSTTSAQATIVVQSPQPLSIQTPINLPTAYTGQSYNNAGINAQGGTGSYTWTANPISGSLPPGLSLTNLNGPTLQFAGSPSATGSYTFTVQVGDGVSTASAQATIVVQTPQPLTITTTQQDISDGLVGAPYGAWINVSGGSGNWGSYVFSVASGSLPVGLSFSSTNPGAITGTPTTAGTYSFQVTVTDNSVSPPGNTATSPTYQIVISNGPDGSANHWLYGQYAFLLRGFVDNPNNSGGGSNALYQSASIGSFFADGSGNIINGVAEVNDGSAFHNKVPFTGTYSIGADNRGIMQLCVNPSGNTCQAWITSNLSNPNAQKNVFAFSVGQIQNVNLPTGTCPTSGATNTSCPVYTDGRLTSFDDAGATPSGAHGNGPLFRQDTTQFTSTTAFQANIAGRWTFGFAGEDASYNSMAAAGVFSADSTSLLGTSVSGGTGITDINDNQTPVNSLAVSGSYNIAKLTTATGRFGSVVMTASGAPAGYPSDYVGYMVNQNRLLFLSNDSHASNSSGLVSGIAYKQQQSSYSSMPSNFVMYMTGPSGGSSSDAFMAQVTCTGTACSVNATDENDGGNYTANSAKAIGNYTIAPSTYGRATLSPAPIMFYLYDSSATGGGVVLNTDSVQLGNLSAQGTVPVSISAMAGSYYMGNMFAFDPNTGGDSGSFTIDSLGNMSGNDDSGGQGDISYGNSISGGSVTVPNTYGVFDIQAGGTPQVTCYNIAPVCSGGGTACGGSTPYAMSACLDRQSNNPQVTIVQQVQ